MEEKEPYRKQAIDELYKKNDLNHGIAILTPKAWLYFLSFLLLLIGVVLWLFGGSITTQVSGRGIIFSKNAKIIHVMSPETGGFVERIKVRTGERVIKNQTIATIINPILIQNIHNLEVYLANESSKLAMLKKQSTNEINARLNSISLSNLSIKEKLKTLEEKKKHLQDFLQLQIKAYKKGIISRLLLSETKVGYFNVRNEISQNKSNLILLTQQKNDYIQRWDQKIRASELKIRESRHDLRLLKGKLELSKKVLSPVSGVVISTYVKIGDYLQKKAILSDVITHSDELEIVAFVNAKDGKKLRRGMLVKIFPEHIKAIEYGGLIGEVYYVGDLPLSKKTIENFIENKHLVDHFLQKGPVIETRINLKRSSKTKSGYLWTTSKGPNMPISIGTMANIKVIVKSQSPLSLIIPVIKNTKNWIIDSNGKY